MSSLPTDSFAFGCLPTGFLTIATALSYLPALALGQYWSGSSLRFRGIRLGHRDLGTTLRRFQIAN
jgi:hypothetical protein